ncbi:DUF4259 domain-containing protein [Corynebacterium terpenotabidum]|uniref:DUF4259 domain-containing protein n=1 Tax=Corynebacterium terpenotabidum Y-11 TaxID=1200352 RepID=S4XFQ2_9CORY|nr:DUF4259 domain-containing protein [Corynebacterium terpenotabidum]AGP31391.1 hypothetical protein A606_08740 [Corynebacterium terpenotabidum Y-11]
MSTWDDTVFADENNVDFLVECDELDERDLVRALQDACTVALNHATPGDADHTTGLCAATVAAIWAGAPFTSAEVADDHPLIRSHIGACPDSFQEVALQVLDGHLDATGEDAPDGLETYVEALS